MPVNKPRRRGSYTPLSVNYYKDEKIIEAGEKAELLYLRGLAFAGETLNDGFISDGQVTRFVGAGLAGVKQRADTLVRVGLWDKVEGGFQILAWLKWNRSSDEIKCANQKDSERKNQKGADSDDE